MLSWRKNCVTPESLFSIELRLAASGMAWKGADTEALTAMSSADIKWAQWLRVARNFQLRVGLKDHRKESFDGFMREVSSSQWLTPLVIYISLCQDHDKLAALLKSHFGVTLETKEVSFKGWNWGVTDFQGLDTTLSRPPEILIDAHFPHRPRPGVHRL